MCGEKSAYLQALPGACVHEAIHTMSYHILHQFDEQWFGDNQQDEESPADDIFQARDGRNHHGQTSRAKSSQRPWLIIILSLIVAASALYFAMEARRETTDLQQRISDLEMKLNR